MYVFMQEHINCITNNLERKHIIFGKYIIINIDICTYTWYKTCAFFYSGPIGVISYIQCTPERNIEITISCLYITWNQQGMGSKWILQLYNFLEN